MSAPIIPSLRDRAVLAYLSISCPSFRKLDRKATTKVTDEAGATSDAARVNKHLLASADAQIKALRSRADSARAYLDGNSLPWDYAGNRMLSNEKAIEVIAHMAKLREEYLAAAEAFCVDYPALREVAMRNLGDLANPDDYPSPERIRDKFKMNLSLTPMPDTFGDMRDGMSPAQVEALQEHYEASVKGQYHRAIEAAYRRLYDDVAKIAERMTPDDEGKRKVFRNSLIENARETCALLKSLNVFDDPELEAVRIDVYTKLTMLEPDALRNSDTAAERVLADANAILGKMQSMWEE